MTQKRRQSEESRDPSRATRGRAGPFRPKALRGTRAVERLSVASVLSKLGFCSRKEAVRLIEAGRCTLRGRVVTSPALRVDPTQSRIAVNGVPLKGRKRHLVVALHKPPGFITSRVDPGGRPTVYELLSDLPDWVFPVGRLDRDTSGLLLLTNDHRLGQRLTDPDEHLPKTYHALVRGVPGEEALRILREGGSLPDGTLCRPARVRSLGAGPRGTWLEIVLTEGKNRQVRRMCRAVGHDVKALARVEIGGLPLGGLPSGQWRRLEASEIARVLGRS